MANIVNSYILYIPLNTKFLLLVYLDHVIKSIIIKGIISYNSP